MGVFDRLRRGPRAEHAPWDDYWYQPRGGGSADVGVLVTREVVLSIPAAWRAISLLSEGVAGLPLGVFTKADGAPYQRPLPPWLQRPNPELITRFELLHQMMVSLLLDSNFYALRARNNAGVTWELWPQNWANVKVWRDSTGQIVYTVNTGNASFTDYSPADMLHIKGFTYPGVFGGISPVDKLAESLGLSLAVQKYAARFFGKGSNMSGLLTLESDPGPDSVKKLEERIEQKFSGLNNSWKIGVLAKAASAKFVQLQHDNDKSQMLETRVHQVLETARIFGVPPHLLYEMTKETTWGSGIEQQGIGFVVYSLRPWLERLEQYLLYELPRPQYLKWNVSGLLRGDMKSRFEAYTMALDPETGWMELEEVRRLEELPPLQEYQRQVQRQMQRLEPGEPAKGGENERA